MQLGLRQNWKQFSILVVINAFVGGMVGLERTILPLIAEDELGLVVKTAILSFIVVFGISKAAANYLTGKLANRYGRKNLLIIGWVFALPVPFLLMFAPNWSWIILANIFLGINQGFTWSSTVVMKIDLVGEKDRGFAMGINEFAGYLAVAILAFVTSWLAAEYGLRPYPFYIGIVLSILGLLCSLFLVHDTHHHVNMEAKSSEASLLNHIFKQTSWSHRQLGSITQAGLVNNLNDGMIWGLMPLFLAAEAMDLEYSGIILATYPAVWGIGQLFTGKMADHFCKKNMLFAGMLIQAIALFGFIVHPGFWAQMSAAAALGFGTAMVYPTFLAAIAEVVHPQQRAESIGVFRLWRDLGYAVGAILTGIIADWFGINIAIIMIGLITFISSMIIKIRWRR